MIDNKHKLDNYLYNLNKSLGSISIGEKAEIITEIKSHILAALEHDSNTTIESILSSLGEPEQVASKYLIERGLKPNRAPFHPVFKWLIIGFLGTLTVFVLFFIILFWKLNPVFSFSDKIGNLELLNGSVKIHFNTANDDDTSIQYIPLDKLISDYKIVDSSQVNAINFIFSNANLNFLNTDESKLIWDCKNTNKEGSISVIENKDIVTFNLKNLANANCNIQFPKVSKVVISGSAGNVSIDKPRNDTQITLDNGIVRLEPSESLKYHFNIKVNNGTLDKFNSVAASESAIPVLVHVDNGRIINN